MRLFCFFSFRRDRYLGQGVVAIFFPADVQAFVSAIHQLYETLVYILIAPTRTGQLVNTAQRQHPLEGSPTLIIFLNTLPRITQPLIQTLCIYTEIHSKTKL